MNRLVRARAWFIHKLLRRPYLLKCRIDHGTGKTVVLLHGLASTAESWRPVIDRLSKIHVRIVAVDLLGFGLSDKPTDPWVRYDANDHARSVLATLDNLALRKPIVLVGHSMGCLVAIEIAKQRPKLVRDLVLYEPPFYRGLPNSRLHTFRVSLYFAMYEVITRLGPISTSRLKGLEKFLAKKAGFILDEPSWTPFTRSLKNTIMQQNSVHDLKQLSIPTQIIYGKYDQVVLRDKRELFFRDTAGNIATTHIPTPHAITRRAAETITLLIREGLRQKRPN